MKQAIVTRSRFFLFLPKKKVPPDSKIYVGGKLFYYLGEIGMDSSACVFLCF